MKCRPKADLTKDIQPLFKEEILDPDTGARVKATGASFASAYISRLSYLPTVRDLFFCYTGRMVFLPRNVSFAATSRRAEPTSAGKRFISYVYQEYG